MSLEHSKQLFDYALGMMLDCFDADLSSSAREEEMYVFFRLALESIGVRNNCVPILKMERRRRMQIGGLKKSRKRS